ncbi:hypothetical protein CAEBREN_01995 [Caenorhabditis brenneri]|uniref:F-box domain-containing protein n=1 Tax=Caenorhabditis brenneri TaxID=135651 RepID=G0NDF3_CAEBE|nr:hypothetical protein CAEBREN_01995 [Caenorhabditis brenneri]
MNRFPLMRLPYVAFREVILSIDKSDVFSLAFSSRKTRRLINSTKNSVHKLSEDVLNGLSAKDKFNIAKIETLDNSIKMTMELELSEQVLLIFNYSRESDFFDKATNSNKRSELEFRIQINSIGDKIGGNQEVMQFGDLYVPVINTKDVICTMWDNREYGFQVMCQYFLQIFKFKRIDLEVDPEEMTSSKFSNFLKTAITTLESPSDEISDLSIENIELMTQTDLHLLFNDKKYNYINIDGPENERFPDNFHCESKIFYVSEAGGFSLKNLLNSKCRTVYLFDTQMTNRVMQKVLKHWLDGKLETLRSLKIGLMEQVNIKRIIDGLSDRTGHKLNRTKKSISIIRVDQKRAVILVPNETTKSFQMTIL